MKPSTTTDPPLRDGQSITLALETPHIPDEATVDLAQFNQFLRTLPLDPIIFHGVAATLRRRFESETTRNITTIDCAILAYDRAVELTPPEDTTYVSRVCDATVAFILPFDEPAFVALRRDRLVASKLDFSRRIEMMKSLAAGVGDDGHPLEATIHRSLANLYYGTFELSGNIDDLSRCISSLERAVSLFQPRGGKEHRNSVFLLSFCLLQRFQLAGDISNYSTTIKYRKELLEDLLLVEEEHRATILEQQSLTLFQRSVATGSLEDLEDSIAHQRQSWVLTPSDSDDYSRRLCSLSAAICRRAGRAKSVAGITEAIAYTRQALLSATTPERRLECLSFLANQLSTRASLTRDVGDQSEAITLQQRAICDINPRHPRYVTMLTSLGTFFMGRYERTNATVDLSYAISAYEEANKHDTQSGANRLELLPKLYILRFQHNRHQSQPDIDKAISTLQKSINLTPTGDPNFLSRWESLALALSLRFILSANAEDINNSICFAEKALSNTPKNDAQRPLRIFRLSYCLAERFDSDLPGVGNDRQDLNRAITLARECVASPIRHASLEASTDSYLAELLARRYTISAPDGDPEDIHEALRCFLKIATDPNSDPLTRNTNAGLLIRYSQHPKQILHACELAVSLYPEYVDVERTTEERYAVLETAIVMVARVSAGYALQHGETQSAVDWMEQSRCLVWTQMDGFHSLPSDLSATHPELAREYMAVGAELKAIGSRSRKAVMDGGSVVDVLKDPEAAAVQQIRKHMELAKAWQDILARIREMQGYSSFLKPMTIQQYLQNAPKEGPVVILTAGKGRVDAVALVAGRGFVHIPLHDVEWTRVEDMARAVRTCLRRNNVRTRDVRRGLRFEVGEGDVGLRDVLADLWMLVVEPVLASLGYSPVEDPESRPRIWWCPAGSFGFLPIHAAGIYGEDAAPGSCVLDYVISSYTPTITMLLKKQAMPQVTRPNSLLLVSQPATPDLPPIPYTKQEADQLESAMGAAGIPVQFFTDDQATIETINKGLPKCTWAHFACHAVQDPAAPLKSGIYLHDDRLELASMIDHLPNAEHAFLSACQTGTGYEKLKEEAVHIAAGMLVAGYRGVVGTMWSISDAYGPIVSKEFYQYLLEKAGPEIDGGIRVGGDVLRFEDEETGPRSERVEGMGSGAPALKRMDCTLSARALHVAISKLRSEVGDDENGLLTWVPYVHFGV